MKVIDDRHKNVMFVINLKNILLFLRNDKNISFAIIYNVEEKRNFLYADIVLSLHLYLVI